MFLSPSEWLFQFLKAGDGKTFWGEGFRPTAYNDGRGVWTIGYGHTAGVKQGDTCTKAQADAWLRDDVTTAVQAVNRFVTVPLTQNQFDALVSLVFNCGSAPLCKTLGAKLNAGRYGDAADQILTWKNAGPLRGNLLPRRKLERAHFLTH